MSIIRIVHNKENPYVQINKKALWDENVSLKAIGLWARCISRPDDWRFNIKELVTKCKEGRRAVDSAIQELIHHGYAIKLEHWEKDPDGKFNTGSVEYVFFEFAATQEDKEKVLLEFKKSYRHCGFSNRRDSNIQNSNLLKKEPTKYKEETKRKGASPPTPCASPPSASQASEEMFTYTSTYSGKCRVKMTLREYKGLVEKYSKEVVEGKLEDLDNYADLNPKKFKTYANHASVLHNWLRKDDNTLVKSKPSPEANKAFAIKIMQLNPSHSKTGLIQMGYNYIEFRTGAHCHEVKFEDNGFKEQCSSCLRKMNLKIPGA